MPPDEQPHHEAKNRANAPSLDELQELFEYDMETGHFTHKCGPCKGQIAGSANTRGNVMLNINRNYYYAHRLAWLFVTGEWPDGGVAHKDKDLGNNAFDNLHLSHRDGGCWNSEG